ncbi:MAG: thioredoxin domain-containing protein [Pseudolysinimonas sp.]|uniref:DsbA family protein n=1 Tax=Pseudolysinimonas sp. TaxID=2680009 RepID=UPI0032665A46
MSESREAARQRASELRAEHRRHDRRQRTALILGITGGMLVVAVIVVVALSTPRTPATGPANMLSDGIKIGQNLVAVPTVGLKADQTPVASSTNAPNVVDIQIYVDYLCPNCGQFEKRNRDTLREWVESGAATVEFHPIAIFTSKSAGTQYSLRAANAAACVAQFSPDDFYAFHDELFAEQPEENTPGLTDEQLIAAAQTAGVADIANVTTCVHDHTYRAWVVDATNRALAGPIPGTDVAKIEATPTIIVNGQEFHYTTAFDPNEFRQFVLRVAGQSFSENATPTSTPTETPAP